MSKINNQFSELIENREWRRLRGELNLLDDVQLAKLIEEADDEEDLILFRFLNRKQSKEVFQHLSFSKQEAMIEGLSHKTVRLTTLINDLEADDRTAFFEELPGQITQKLFQLLTAEQLRITMRLLGYPDNSIGRLMTPAYIAVKPQQSVESVFQLIRLRGKNFEILNSVYVIDDNWKLLDDIKIKDLILASPEESVSELMDDRCLSLYAMDDQESAVQVFRDYDRTALPVVNQNGILLGIVTVDDIMDVEEEETTEDFHKFGAFQSPVPSPLKAPIFSLYKTRVIWLLALVFTNVFSGAALSSYEDVIQSVVSLIFFLPMLIAGGGNAGSQSATLMIRSLAVGDTQLSDWYKLIGRELLVSFLLGVTMAAGVALIASVRAPEIIAVVSITMVLIVIVGSLIGMLLPFLFTKLKLDPAAASAPLVTSLADICGVVIYFSVAHWYLPQMI